MTSAPSAPPDIGRLLDGRYRVEGLVARGGMAAVHRGHDERLDRTVALKLMHPHLAADPQFRARFTREARAAARLSHPAVVSVFDHGEDGDHAYLAMELIDGGTLREEVREGALTVRRALRIAIPVVEALRAAHESGIVHRDIKPENVLLARDGRVKVTDFGLARAIGSSTASATGTLLGTVAYVSPEVVTRGHCDERSDLYSLGVMLFEMLTGHQPFTGEQPVHVAFQHVHESIPAPSSIVPTVPKELDSIVTWCCARSPASRPRSAAELLGALEDAAARVPAVALDAVPVIRDDAATGDVPHVTASLDDAALTRDAAPRAFPAGEGGGLMPPRPGATRSDADASLREVSAPAPPTRPGRHLPPAARRRSPLLGALALLAALALVAGSAWAGLAWYRGEGPGADRTVPAVAGTTLADAESVLEGEDLAVRTRDTFSDTVPDGHVVQISPAPGTTLKAGDPVVVLVSRGVETFPVPAVQGSTLDEARAAVEAAGLTLVEDEPAYDERVPQGSVISQSAAAEALPAGGEVHVVVSRGAQPIAVPDTRGRPAAEATAALKAQGFLVRTDEAFSPTVPAGSVITQDPPSGSARRGATIGITVSKGPEMVTVPDVFQRPEAEAVGTLQGAGFDVSVVHDKGTPVFGLVYEQSAAGGTQAAKGSAITIKVF